MRLAFAMVLFSVALWAREPRLTPLEKIQKLHLVNACYIHDSSGAILQTLPGRFCLFFDTGDFLSASDTNLRYITKDNEVKWELPGHFHHQLNLSADGKRILALNSNVFADEGVGIREDRLQIISLEGKVLHEQTTRKLLEAAELNWPDFDVSIWVQDLVKAPKEISHFNSFYEISKMPKNSFFKEGDLIANSNGQGIFVLSPDLQTLRLHHRLSDKVINTTHDVQVTERGTLLLFLNQNSDALGEDTFSAIQEYAVPSFRLVWEYTARPKAMFYSRACGGVQDLGDGLIQFSDHLNGMFVYSKSKKDIVWSVRETHFLNGELRMTQQVKLVDLSRFLSHRP